MRNPRRFLATSLGLVLVGGGLLFTVVGAGPAAACVWNPQYSEPVEDASNHYVDFRDGPVCYVWVFPCDDHSTRICWPQ